jgi:hypothetical protein
MGLVDACGAATETAGLDNTGLTEEKKMSKVSRKLGVGMDNGDGVVIVVIGHNNRAALV